jgi:tellurite resistance protein
MPPKFPPFTGAKPRLWEATPPAIFPPILGLFGLGLAWRLGVGEFGLPGGLAEAFLGGVTLLYLFAMVAWVSKPLRRLSVIGEELRILPGRAGVAAASMCLMLLAAVLVPYAPTLALVIGALALFKHAVLAVLVVRSLLTGPAEARVVTPVFHLVFVGFILWPLSAIPLGLEDAARVVLWALTPIAVLIWGASLWQLVTRVPPAPLRPLLAIHLNPASLFCIIATALGMPGLATFWAAVGGVIFLTLVISVRWLTAGGFSALWGAFTFPLAAFSAALLGMGRETGLPFVATGGAMLLIAATLIIPPIAVQVMRLWSKGTLAKVTNAARV